MKKFLIALSFYTRIPIFIKSEVSEEEFYSSMTLLPVVGLIIGGILYIPWYLLREIPKEIVSFLMVFLYIWLTGGLHIDGFIDTLDGILSNRDRERVLEIMKDSRVGSFGVIGLILLVLGYFVMFQYIDGIGLIFMPMVGKTCALIAASLSQYARKDKGLGKRFIESTGKKERRLAFIFTILVIGILDLLYLIPFFICVLISYYSAHFFQKKLSGMTGDTMGMVVELNQIVFLFSSYLIVTYFVS